MNQKLILFVLGALPNVACALKGGEKKMLREALEKKDMSHILETGRDTALLSENGFLIKPIGDWNIYDIYNRIADEEILYTDGPIFIAADLYLHSLHRLLDYTVRLAEVDYLMPRLEKLSNRFLDLSLKEYKNAKGDWKKAWMLNVVYFGVAVALSGKELPPLPKEIQELVDAELELIKAAQGFSESPTFGTEADYSQFIPRGHYTVAKDLTRYFLAMMWLGRTGFSLRPYDPIHARAALSQAWLLSKDSELLTAWTEMERVIALFSGQSDDLNPAEISGLLGGRDPAKLSEVEIRMIADSAAKIKPPKILSGVAYSFPDEPMEIPMTYRIFGQRSVPDSYILQELIYDRVNSYTGRREPFTLGETLLGPQRCFARGLDVMAAIGNEMALDIIKSEGDADYGDYSEQMAKVRKWWEKEPKEGNNYLLWLTMVSEYMMEARPPSTVKPKAWEIKTLLTSLGSWAQLRHDYILYAKQTYGPKAGAEPFDAGGPPPKREKLKLAYIEDAGGLFAAGAKFARELARAMPDMHQVKEKCGEFAALSDSLSMVAEKQKNGLSKDDHLWLWGVPSELRWASQYDWQTMDRISDYDEGFPLIADVLTDPNSGRCVEVGVGEPLWIGVLVLIDGKPYIAEGACFSYYEFKQPISERLSDEDWRYWDGERPGRQKWLEGIGGY
ncbi:MAG: DUF3160 domain-containing protein [candidate division WOR-3 bacterium]